MVGGGVLGARGWGGVWGGEPKQSRAQTNCETHQFSYLLIDVVHSQTRAYFLFIHIIHYVLLGLLARNHSRSMAAPSPSQESGSSLLLLLLLLLLSMRIGSFLPLPSTPSPLLPPLPLSLSLPPVGVGTRWAKGQDARSIQIGISARSSASEGCWLLAGDGAQSWLAIDSKTAFTLSSWNVFSAILGRLGWIPNLDAGILSSASGCCMAAAAHVATLDQSLEETSHPGLLELLSFSHNSFGNMHCILAEGV